MTKQSIKNTLENITTYCDLEGISVEEYIERRQVMHDVEIEWKIDELLILNEQYS